MTNRPDGAATRIGRIDRRRRLATAAAVTAPVVWAGALAVAAVVMADAALRLTADSPAKRDGFIASLRLAFVVAAVVAAPPLVVRAVRPAWTAPALAVTTGGVVVALATTAGALPDLLVASALAVAMHELGRLGLRALGLHPALSPLESAVLAGGLGFGLLGLVALALGSLGWLRPAPVALALAPLLVLALWRCVRLPAFTPWSPLPRKADVRRYPKGRGCRRETLTPSPPLPVRGRGGNRPRRLASIPIRPLRQSPLSRCAGEGVGGEGLPSTGWIPSWAETVLLAVAAAFLAVGAIAALAPEVSPDAVWHHLAIARVFADQGRLPVLPHLGTSRWPVGGQAVYALGMLLHGQIAAKLIHTWVVWLVVGAAGALGARYAGRTAGITAAALVAGLPVVVWEAGTAHVDAPPMLFGLLAALCLLAWQQIAQPTGQRAGQRAWLPLLGALLGFGLAAKLTFGFTAAALGLTLGLVGRAGETRRARLAALAWVAVGSLVAVLPWLLRSVAATGELPGVDLFLDAIGRGSATPASISNLPGFGIGRSPADLLALPFALTFRGERFGENPPGFVGVALLLLLPTVLLLPRSRATATLAVAVAVSTLLWFLTAQYIRYLLPTLALLATMLGAGFAALLRRCHWRLRWRPDRGGRAAGAATTTALATAALAAVLGASLVYFLAAVVWYPGGLPVDLVLGRQSREAYLTATRPDYAPLQRLDQLVPPGTPVAALTLAPSQLYTHATLLTQRTGLPELLEAEDAGRLFAALARHRIDYLIVDGPAVLPAWSDALILQPAFLAAHTTVVFAENDVSLYRLHARPDPETDPAESRG